MSVFPNPTHEQLTVRVPAVSGAVQASLALYSLLGQPMRETTLALPAAGVQASFDVAELPMGAYVLCVKAGNTTITKQVLISQVPFNPGTVATSGRARFFAPYAIAASPARTSVPTWVARKANLFQAKWLVLSTLGFF